MSSPKPLEEKLLEPISTFLARKCEDFPDDSFEFRLQVLEATASRLGGFSLAAYYESFDIIPKVSIDELDQLGSDIAGALSTVPIHPGLALSALAREPLHRQSQRTSGAYHTDFRLASYVAASSNLSKRDDRKVLDPACGAGILLVAVAIAIAGADKRRAAKWIAGCVFASDLSKAALRGTRLSLASLTNDLDSIRSMWSNFRCQDSLLASETDWNDLSPDGFDLIVGNPPWEKIKITRHEFLQAHGKVRHYGSDYGSINESVFAQKKRDVSKYGELLASKYDQLGSGEIDLYMAFLQLCSQLVRPGGVVSILVPAGLIRSQGTQKLREYLLNHASILSITVFENRAKFFSIDTRFKFLAVSYERPSNARKSKAPINLLHAKGVKTGVCQTGTALIGRKTLAKVRPDLSIPEVRSTKEWRIFVRMANNGIDWSSEDSEWRPQFRREVDMTRDRKNFALHATSTSLPVIEGRMIQAHRFGAKKYVSGTGRRAVWAHAPFGSSLVEPQFWIEPVSLSESTLARSTKYRAGFCDITGQTNERSMMATIIPPGTVCGNKVPTIVFPPDQSERQLLIWSVIVNSIPFDWMLRRVITTTVNYFLLLSTQLPRVIPDSLVGQRLFELGKKLIEMDTAGSGYDHRLVANHRAEADVLVLGAYDLGMDDLEVMLEDFPLLDRGQPPIYGESKSTVTRDYLLHRAARRFECSEDRVEKLCDRLEEARTVGAMPYVPSEYSGLQVSTEVEREQSAS